MPTACCCRSWRQQSSRPAQPATMKSMFRLRPQLRSLSSLYYRSEKLYRRDEFGRQARPRPVEGDCQCSLDGLRGASCLSVRYMPPPATFEHNRCRRPAGQPHRSDARSTQQTRRVIGTINDAIDRRPARPRGDQLDRRY